MKRTQSTLVLTKEDHSIIQSYLTGSSNKYSFDRKNAAELQQELKKAKLVSPDKFPEDAVRLNSKVKVREDENDKVMELILVTPDKANINERKISVMAPVGVALLGFRKGQKVNWEVPSGKKTFTILEVSNQPD